MDMEDYEESDSGESSSTGEHVDSESGSESEDQGGEETDEEAEVGYNESAIGLQEANTAEGEIEGDFEYALVFSGKPRDLISYGFLPAV